MPGKENPQIELKNPVVSTMRHRTPECFHRDGDRLKDVIF